MTPSLPLLVVELARVYLDQIDGLSEKVAGLDKAIACEARRGDTTRRLQTMPGVGPITAMAIETFAPPMEVFRRGRDFAAWLGLVPLQHSTGGKQVLGRTSKMGQRDIRRLLITGAMVIVRWACRKGAREGTWLHRMLGRKPRMLVAIALANKMARSIWAMLTKEEDYRGPVAATL
jgi:transposase